MKDRIKEFMLSKSLTAADFADRIGVQRSNISHILSGRNNPGAQFMEKILRAFPDLSAEWLITGDGEMLKVRATGPHREEVPDREVARNREVTERHSSGEVMKEFPFYAGDKKPERIVVFFTDKTFSLYYPEA